MRIFTRIRSCGLCGDGANIEARELPIDTANCGGGNPQPTSEKDKSSGGCRRGNPAKVATGGTESACRR